MTDSEKVELRKTCVIEAIKLKQIVIHSKDEANDFSVVKIAKELEIFIVGEQGSK